MKRRQLLAGLGAAAAGGGVLGTGAFTSVSASRSVSVSLANEDAAYLGIEPGDGKVNGVFANQNTDNEITVDINDEITTYSDSGTGVGVDSEYEFDDVFRVTNQGTQTVSLQIDDVTHDPDGDGNTEVLVQFYVRDGSGNRQRIDGSNAEAELSTGTVAQIGIYVETSDYDVSSNEDLNGATTVQADADGFGAGTVVTL